MADRTYTERPIFAYGVGTEYGPVIMSSEIVHTASESWVRGWILERHATLPDTLIEWGGSNAPVAILAQDLDVSTTAALGSVAHKGYFNSKYLCVGSSTVRPTQAQIVLLQDAGLYVVGGEHA